MIVLWFYGKSDLDEYMRVHARMVKDKLAPHMAQDPMKGGSFLAEIDVPEESERSAGWKKLGVKL